MNVHSFKNKLGDKIADYIDLHVEIEPVEFDQLASREPGESLAEIRRRVIAPRNIQHLRHKDEPGIHCNAQMNSRLLHKYAWPDETGLAKLKERMEKLSLSARAFDRILRVARTIADLDYSTRKGADGRAAYTPSEAAALPVLTMHLAEAIGYRSLDRASYGFCFQ